MDQQHERASLTNHEQQ